MYDIKSCVLKMKNHYLLDMTVVHYIRVLDCLLVTWCGSFFAGSTENITMICLVSAKRNMENKQCQKRVSEYSLLQVLLQQARILQFLPERPILWKVLYNFLPENTTNQLYYYRCSS